MDDMPKKVKRRARRRHDLNRMKAKARRLSRRYSWNLAKHYNHLAFCSCRACGNQRKHEGPPVRELRELQDAQPSEDQ